MNKNELIKATYSLMMECNLADHDEGNELPSHYAGQSSFYGMYSDILTKLGVDTDMTAYNGEITMMDGEVITNNK